VLDPNREWPIVPVIEMSRPSRLTSKIAFSAGPSALQMLALKLRKITIGGFAATWECCPIAKQRLARSCERDHGTCNGKMGWRRNCHARLRRHQRRAQTQSDEAQKIVLPQSGKRVGDIRSDGVDTVVFSSERNPPPRAAGAQQFQSSG